MKQVSRHVLLCCLALAAFLPATGSVALAQRSQMSAEIDASSPAVRSSAPIVVVWKLTPQTSNLLEGRLSLVLWDEREIVCQFVTDEMVINSGEQIIKTVLPALDAMNPFAQLEIELEFIGKREKIRLGRHPLRVPGRWQRSFIDCVCDPWGSNVSAERKQFIDQLRFETFNPNPDDRTVTTFPAHVRPEVMPADPLGYCGFDVVLLMHEGFAELREKQLEALLEWVDAGGSLCVVPSGILAAQHAAFLNKLITTDAARPPFVLDSAGRLIDEAGDGKIPATLRRKGLGRAVVLHGSLSQFLEAPDSIRALRRAAAFLWKMRRDHSALFIETGKWNPTLVAEAQHQSQTQAGLDPLNQLRPKNLQLGTVPLQSGDQLLAKLMPQDIKVVPLNLIFGVLFLYVLAVGPGDYFVLGALKQRRLTWIVFPAVTLAVTLLTVGLSNWYMRSAEQRRSVVFADVGDGGKLVRQSRFELLFTSRQRTVETEVRKQIFSPLNHQMFGQATWYQYQQSLNYGNRKGMELVAPAAYFGRLPSSYTVAQQMPQWTPQLNRLFSISPANEGVAIDWDALPVRDCLDPAMADRQEWRDAVRQAVQKGLGESASVYVFKGGSVQHLAGPAIVFQASNVQYMNGVAYVNGQPASMAGNVAIPNRQGDTNNGLGFLTDTCVQTQPGLFSIISQLSPTAGPNFEDLALLDASDPRQALLVVAVERAGELWIYRKLYVGEN